MRNRIIVKQNGFTLLELMVVIAILGILATLAAPNYRNLIERNKIRSALNEWQNSFYLAQREAMRLKEPVTFCGSSNGKECDKDEGNIFNNGWIVISDRGMVFQDNNFNDPRVDIRIGDNKFPNGITFASNGRTNSAFGTLTIKMSDWKDANDPRVKTLTISSAGRLIGVKR